MRVRLDKWLHSHSKVDGMPAIKCAKLRASSILALFVIVMLTTACDLSKFEGDAIPRPMFGVSASGPLQCRATAFPDADQPNLLAVVHLTNPWPLERTLRIRSLQHPAFGVPAG